VMYNCLFEMLVVTVSADVGIVLCAI